MRKRYFTQNQRSGVNSKLIQAHFKTLARPAGGLSHGFMIWVDRETLLTLIQQARGEEMGVPALVRKWVQEHVERPNQSKLCDAQ